MGGTTFALFKFEVAEVLEKDIETLELGLANCYSPDLAGPAGHLLQCVCRTRLRGQLAPSSQFNQPAPVSPSPVCQSAPTESCRPPSPRPRSVPTHSLAPRTPHVRRRSCRWFHLCPLSLTALPTVSPPAPTCSHRPTSMPTI
jgi:hypothetical protein